MPRGGFYDQRMLGRPWQRKDGGPLSCLPPILSQGALAWERGGKEASGGSGEEGGGAKMAGGCGEVIIIVDDPTVGPDCYRS